MFSMDLANRVITWDKGAEDVFGYRREDVLHENARFIFTPEDLERCVPESEIRTAREQDLAVDERWHVKKDGTIFWGSGLMIKVRDDSNHHVGYLKIVRDRTQDKKLPQPRPNIFNR